MPDALKVLWRALRHFNHRGYVYIWANVAAMVCSLPIVTAPAAWAGLVKLSYEAHLSGAAKLDDFKEGFIQNLGRGLILALLNMLVIGINLINILNYREQTGTLISVMRFVWLMTLAVWFSVQLYLFPIFYHMQEPSLWGAMRNALMMVFLNPLFTLVLWIGILLIVLLSSAFVVAWVLLTLSVLAVIATQAALNRMGGALPAEANEEEYSAADL